MNKMPLHMNKIKLFGSSIKKSLFVVTVRNDVLIPGTSIQGAFLFLCMGISFLGEMVLLSHKFLGHFVEIEAVDLSIMS